MSGSDQEEEKQFDAELAPTSANCVDNGALSHVSNVSTTEMEDVELQNHVGLEKERHGSTGSRSGKGRDSVEQQSVEYYCGIGRCRPSWMQRLRDARFFTFLLCCNTFIEGALVSGGY